MKKHHVFIVLLSLILVAACTLGLVSFFSPYQRQSTMWACSLEGDAVEVKIDLQYHRRLFQATYVEGSVFLDGVEFIDSYSKFPTGEGFSQSLNGSEIIPSGMMFFLKDSADSLAAMNDHLVFYFTEGTDTIEHLHYIRMAPSQADQDGSDRGVSYFGPAKTAEEAKQIAAFLGFVPKEDSE